MRQTPPPTVTIVRRPDPVARVLAGGALVTALAALVFAMTGLSQARPEPAANPAAAKTAKKAPKKKAALPGPSRTPRKYGILRLNAKKQFPAGAIPTVAMAKEAQSLDGASREDLALSCPQDTVDLGTWCLLSSTFPVPPEDVGKNDFLYAARQCVAMGGYLPSAAQLVGAAGRVKLAGTIDDSPLSAATDLDVTDGLKDQREMSGSLFTVTAGSSAAGSEGVTAGSRGDPKQGESDPVPAPADPLPDTLDYVTVFDNHDAGGFAGGKAVGTPERFRCAFDKAQGAVAAEQ